MPPAEREGQLGRRLRQLEEEEKQLRQSMKQLNRELRKLERGATDEIDPRLLKRTSAPEPESEPAASAPPPAPSGLPVRSMPGVRKSAAPEDERFVTYFASGFERPPRAVGRARQVQRNKAIFMLIFVLLVGYLVYRLTF